MSEYQQKRRTVLITGASSGIGYELAKILAKNGFDLVLVARSDLKLANAALEFQQQHLIRAVPLSKDLSEPNAARELYDLLTAQGIAVERRRASRRRKHDHSRLAGRAMEFACLVLFAGALAMTVFGAVEQALAAPLSKISSALG